MRKLQSYSRQILSPLLKDPKYSFIYTISSNLNNIINKKYIDYCKIEKVVLNQENRKGNIYFITYNSAVSFYLNNNKDYIIEKINSLFGYSVVSNIYTKEIPTIIKKSEKIPINKNFKLQQKISNATLGDALEKLGSTIFIE